MRSKKHVSAWLAAFTLMIALNDSEAAQLKVGQSFPRLAFPDLDGHPGSIADFQGKKTVLHIFASW